MISKAFSLQEISVRSGLSVYVLQKAIKSGELKAFKLDDSSNSRLKILEADFEEFIDRRKTALSTSHARFSASS